MTTNLTAAIHRCRSQMTDERSFDDEDALFRVGDVRALLDSIEAKACDVATDRAVDSVSMQTIDPETLVDGRPVPALTTLLYRVCNSNSKKFNEAERLVQLFIRHAINMVTTLPQLHGWQFQPDDDTPGLYLQCSSQDQRRAIMHALGWYADMPEYREDSPTGL